MYLTNAFSLNMVNLENGYLVKVDRIAPADVPANLTSAIGHVDTARIVSDMLGREIPANRITVSLGLFDECIVAQYTGPRLPEGATTLPEGASLAFFWITILPS